MHPMYDYETKSLLTYTFLHSKLVRKTKIWFYSFGGTVDIEPLKYVIKDRAALHMFGFTKRYYVLFSSPLEAKMSSTVCGTPVLRALDDDYCGDLIIHFIPRPGINLVPFSINTKQQGFVYHSINCYDLPNGSIVVDAYVSKLNPSRESAQFELGDNPVFENEGDPFRFLVNPKGTVENKLICSQMDSSIDFHCINPLYNGKMYESWWMIAHRRNRGLKGVVDSVDSVMYHVLMPKGEDPLNFNPMTTIVNTKIWQNMYLRTPNFIPYAGVNAEDEGLLLCWAYLQRTESKELDAKILILTPSLEAIRTLTPDSKIPYSVHSYVHIFEDEET